MEITTLVVGQLQTNCYIAADSGSAVIIDPGDDAQFISTRLSDLRLTPTQILATHGHFDHILAAFELQHAYNIPFRIHEKDRFLVERMHETARFFLKYEVADPAPEITQTYTDSDIIAVGEHSLAVIETAGHTPGSVSFYDAEGKILFTGDTLFANGGVGRTDFKYSSTPTLQKSIKKLFTNPLETVVYPGHGSSTTLREESAYHLLS